MTKAKANKLMLEYDRNVIDPALASKITKAYGLKLSDLGIKAKKVSEFPIIYSEETKELKAVATYYLAQELAFKITGERPSSMMNGRGSSAEDIVKKAVALLIK